MKTLDEYDIAVLEKILQLSIARIKSQRLDLIRITDKSYKMILILFSVCTFSFINFYEVGYIKLSLIYLIIGLSVILPIWILYPNTLTKEFSQYGISFSEIPIEYLPELSGSNGYRKLLIGKINGLDNAIDKNQLVLNQLSENFNYSIKVVMLLLLLILSFLVLSKFTWF